MKKFDALVIGGGPAGLTAALYLVRSGVKLAWVEKLAPGGQVLNTEWIENYPGFPEPVRGYELIERMEKQLGAFSFERYLDEVTSIELGSAREKTIHLAGGEDLEARSVIVCTGAKHRKLGLPGEDRLQGQGVSYCALCDGNFFKGQRVACIGGGNTALEESLYLAGLAERVFLIHRRDEFRGDKIYQDKVFANPKIEVILDTVPLEILGADQVEGVRLKNVKTKSIQDLEVEGVFVFVGMEPVTDFLPPEIECNQQGFIKTDAEMQTNVSGVFAAGDVRFKRCRQVATAVGDGATAAHSAYIYLSEYS